MIDFPGEGWHEREPFVFETKWQVWVKITTDGWIVVFDKDGELQEHETET